MTNNVNEQKLLSCEEIDAFKRLRESLVAVGFQVATASPSALCDVIEGLMFDDVEKLKAAAAKHAEAWVVALKTQINEATAKALETQTDALFDVSIMGRRAGKSTMTSAMVQSILDRQHAYAFC